MQPLKLTDLLELLQDSSDAGFCISIINDCWESITVTEAVQLQLHNFS